MEALLIIDVQNDYFPGGKHELDRASEALARIQLVLEKFRALKQPVIFVRHINTREGASFFLPGTEGAKIHSSIVPSAAEPVIIKHMPDSFYQTELLKLLESMDIHKLVICGMMTHMCIDTTVRAARNYGYEVTLLHDACAAGDLVWEDAVIPAGIVQQVFMASLSGSFATVTDTTALCNR